MIRANSQGVANLTTHAILVLIALQAVTPNAIAKNFSTSRQAVSKYYSMFKACELAKQKQKGREIYFSPELVKIKENDKKIEQFRKI